MQPLLAEITFAQGMFLGGLCLLIFILLSRSRRYFRKKKTETTALPAANAQAAIAAAKLKQAGTNWQDAPDEMRRWQVEMHELARDYSARMDSKIAMLQSLLIDAEEMAARLESLLDRAEHSELSNDRKPANTHESISQRLTDQRVDAKLKYVCALADEGYSAEAIAERLNRAVGDIELLLSVRPPREQT